MRTPTRIDDPDVEDGIYYPSSDGEPMAENDFHWQAIVWLVEGLKDYFGLREDVYIAGDIFWYWEQGNPRACRSPDAMVVFGVRKDQRRSFRSWNEGGAIPRVCFEVASPRTWRANLNEIYHDYESVGVREYFIFDPTREYLDAPLLGYRLQRGVYQPISRLSNDGMKSRELGLTLLPEDTMLRLVNTKTGQRVLTRQEQIEHVATERDQVMTERNEVVAERDQVITERDEVAAERDQIATERDQAVTERDAERRRAEALTAEVERLRAVLNAQMRLSNGVGEGNGHGHD